MSLKYEYFGKFVLLDKVAAGGMAEVYRAKSPGAEGIGKILAIKRILPQYTSNNEFIEMFKSEANIAINLTQGNIAQIYEFGEDKKQFYLLMEYIDGRNLRQCLSRCSKLQKALTIEQCVYIISQVANGLDYAHRCIDKNTGGPLNIIHRDMSPQNIMISFEGEVKIIDFGIAKAESKIENTRAGTLKGKFGYMSPEQAEGLDLDARTDIFSTGIVLWELLSGERLFIANNEVNTIRKIKECQIPSLRKINPNIHEELERITLKALAKDRNLRYQSAAELHRDLSRFLYKVNPEFTQHDLAVTIKTLFKDDILEDRKKSLEFAKVKFPDPKEDKTDVTGESTKTMTETTQSTAPAVERKESPKNLIPEPKLDMESIDFGDVKGKDIVKDHMDHFNARFNNGNTSQIVIQTPSSGNRNTTSYRTSTNSRAGRRQQNPLSKFLPFILVLIGLSFGAYFFVVKAPTNFKPIFTKVMADLGQYFSQGKDTVGHVKCEIMHNCLTIGSTEGANIPLPSPVPPVARVQVRSIPAGADIIINDKVLGTTPLEIKLPINQVTNITLKKDGYITYSKEYIGVSEELDDFEATLQKAIVGYIDIEVKPSTADTYIKINGQRLAEKPPIHRYAVPADKPIKIQAINAFSNMSAQQAVVVKQDTVKSVTLYLGRSNSP